MKRLAVATLLGLAWTLAAHAQTELRTEAQVTATDGRHTPLWLNANRHGLSSLETTNGYLRAGLFHHQQDDSCRQWRLGFGADVAVATGFSSTLVVQQAYGELGWKKGLLTLGSKEQDMQLKNGELSSGSQTLGVNARPVPGARIELPQYWEVPGLDGWLAFKGHIFYGWTTDDGWQKDFTHRQSRHTEHTMLHTKAGYLRLGPADRPFNVEMGLEMGCQFGGKSLDPSNGEHPVIENDGGLSSLVHAFIPGGGDAHETDYRNKEGNHLGSWVLRANYDRPAWGVSLYADHFFEDQSQMFLLDYDGYGTGDAWDQWEHFSWMVYDLRDMMLGAELRLHRCSWLQAVVAEYLYTKYQSGPVYHDHTRTLSDHVGGLDYYYNHSVFTGWQHWGQVMGNPLYRSPLYNSTADITVADNRFWAWYVAVGGTPAQRLHYRLMATWQKGFGTYSRPFIEPRRDFSLMAEAAYAFADGSALRGWTVRAAVALDRGSLLGNNSGAQLTVARKLSINHKK